MQHFMVQPAAAKMKTKLKTAKQYFMGKMVPAGALVICLLAAPSSKALTYTVETPYDSLGMGFAFQESFWAYDPVDGSAQTVGFFGNSGYIPSAFTVSSDDGSVGQLLMVEFVFEFMAVRQVPSTFYAPAEELANFTGFGPVTIQSLFHASSGGESCSFGLSGDVPQVGDSLLEYFRWTVPLEVGTQHAIDVHVQGVRLLFQDPVVEDPTRPALGLIQGLAQARVVDIRIAPVPDAGSTMLLMGIGLGCLGVIARHHTRISALPAASNLRQ